MGPVARPRDGTADRGGRSTDRSPRRVILRCSSRLLADGREIIYFDADADADTDGDTGSSGPRGSHDVPDRRDLPAAGNLSQLRFDPLLGEWVVIAGHRQSRTFLPPADLCPLCPSGPGRPSEVPDEDYQVVVFENRFPALAAGAEPVEAATAPGNPLSAQRPGRGRCEVVCFTSDHHRSFADLGLPRARLVVDAWAHRTEALSALPGVAQVFVFENNGEEIGVTLSHPHGQIYAYPFVAPRVARMLEQVTRHRQATGGDLFGEVIDAESAGPRVVTADAHWVAFVPAAARWPCEVQLFPRRQVPDLAALGDVERDALARVYLDLLGRFAHLFDTPANYIAAWAQAPIGAGREAWWLHLQLFSLRRAADKLKYLAGSESGMGVFVSDTNPEAVAEQLRAARPARPEAPSDEQVDA